MATYVIGDIQGCYKPFRALLDEIEFDPDRDRLWLAGDLVNRGPDNLSVLRYCCELGERVRVVLGNHDLHLLAAAAGVRPPGRKDTIADVLNASDRDQLLHWLKQQHLMYCEGDFCLSHAGVPHIWDHQQARSYAREVETVLRGPQSNEFFQNMYGNKPNRWSNDLKDWQRLRLITNYFTRMRFIDPQGSLDFDAKEGPDKPPLGMSPWFSFARPKADEGKHFLFGHWAALDGYTGRERMHALDTGCVWGGYLSALELEDMQIHRISHKARVKCFAE